MSFREFLKGMDLESDKIEKIMAEYGAQTSANIKKVDELEKQLKEAPKKEDFDKLNQQVADLTTSNEKLTTEKADLETKSASDLKALKKDYAINLAVQKSNPIDEVAYRAHLDASKLEYDEEKNVLTGFEEQDKAIRSNNPYLFNVQAGGDNHGGFGGGSGDDYDLAGSINEWIEKQ